ncbi:hypothetical protein O6H91_15G024900 [Diphasiastrum complanatum]|uniref:Uncharacterized protein n=1 Tax=Diphasiastrum complanatum TaxID=34168 RepID=A0ACC2BGF8_DIPCM|nr:hypothetical protein O6H91_15G024900 [Diphasiastrum complanatum]
MPPTRPRYLIAALLDLCSALLALRSAHCLTCVCAHWTPQTICLRPCICNIKKKHNQTCVCCSSSLSGQSIVCLYGLSSSSLPVHGCHLSVQSWPSLTQRIYV